MVENMPTLELVRLLVELNDFNLILRYSTYTQRKCESSIVADTWPPVFAEHGGILISDLLPKPVFSKLEAKARKLQL